MSFQSGMNVHVRAGLMAILGALYLLMGMLVRRKANQKLGRLIASARLAGVGETRCAPAAFKHTAPPLPRRR